MVECKQTRVFVGKDRKRGRQANSFETTETKKKPLPSRIKRIGGSGLCDQQNSVIQLVRAKKKKKKTWRKEGRNGRRSS